MDLTWFSQKTPHISTLGWAMESLWLVRWERINYIWIGLYYVVTLSSVIYVKEYWLPNGVIYLFNDGHKTSLFLFCAIGGYFITVLSAKEFCIFVSVLSLWTILIYLSNMQQTCGPFY